MYHSFIYSTQSFEFFLLGEDCEANVGTSRNSGV
jgi:hypothetical protein